MDSTPVSIGALCAGYGGLELGLAMAGMTVDLQWYAEIDKNAAAVMAAHHPDVPNLGDLTEITNPPPVDMIAAGFPCQPVSMAGKRRGIHDDRWLIEDVCRIGRDSGAKWLLLENVPGILTANASEAFGKVIGALAENGFAAEWTCLRASDVGAAHRRLRWFCLGYADGVVGPPPLAVHWGSGSVGEQGPVTGIVGSDGASGGTLVADALSERTGVRGDVGGQERFPGGTRSATLLRPDHGPTGADGVAASGEVVSDTDGTGSQRHGAERESRSGSSEIETTRNDGDASHTNGVGWDQSERQPRDINTTHSQGAATVPDGHRAGIPASRWGPYVDAVQRWEPIIGRTAPEPTDSNRSLNPQFVEWMMGLPEGWVTDILNKRGPALKCLGNGVVPQQAARAIHLLIDQWSQPTA